MLRVATQERNGLVKLGQGIHSHGRHLAFHRTLQETAFQWLQGFYSVCKTSNYTASKKAFFHKGIFKFLNLSGKSPLMDPCHSKDGQKSAPAWSSWHINVRFDDIVYLYFKTINIYKAVNSAIKGNWKHRAAHLTTLTQDANYRFSEDDSGKQSTNVLKNECHSW